MLALGGEGARDDLVGGVIAAHGVDGQHRTWHRTVGTGHAEVPGAFRVPRAAAAVGSAHFRALGPGLGSALVRPDRRPPLRVVRCRAQRVTRGGSGRG